MTCPPHFCADMSVLIDGLERKKDGKSEKECIFLPELRA